jgi:hypothetical protein
MTLCEVEKKPAQGGLKESLESVVFNNRPEHLDTAVIPVGHRHVIGIVQLFQDLRPIVRGRQANVPKSRICASATSGC